MAWLQKLFRGGPRKMTKAQGDRLVMEKLKDLGADMNQPREVIHFLYLPSQHASR
jgi:hypothetical protein